MSRELFSTQFANESGTMPVPIFGLSTAFRGLFTWGCAASRYVSFCRDESRMILDDPLLAGLFFHIIWCVGINNVTRCGGLVKSSQGAGSYRTIAVSADGSRGRIPLGNQRSRPYIPPAVKKGDTPNVRTNDHPKQRALPRAT